LPGRGANKCGLAGCLAGLGPPACWLTDLLAGWLAGLGWLFGCSAHAALVGSLVWAGWLAGCLVGWLPGWLAGWLVGWQWEGLLFCCTDWSLAGCHFMMKIHAFCNGRCLGKVLFSVKSGIDSVRRLFESHAKYGLRIRSGSESGRSGS